MKRQRKYKDPYHQNLGQYFTRLDKKKDQTIYDAMDGKRKMTKSIRRIMNIREDALTNPVAMGWIIKNNLELYAEFERVRAE